jgi:hypothetical protein
MSDQESTEERPEVARDRRRGERRSGDRRRPDRRASPPYWRHPAAFVAYGVVGALLLSLLFRGGDERSDRVVEAAVESGARPQRVAPQSGPVVPTREAYSPAQYERLLAEGEDAVGEIVRTELFCGSINPVAVRDTDRPHPGLVALADADGRVAAAECRWSRESRSSDFLLVVPPDLAEEFARAPEVELNFVRRRQVRAHVEWLGRSEALSLRNAGVLREILL